MEVERSGWTPERQNCQNSVWEVVAWKERDGDKKQHVDTDRLLALESISLQIVSSEDLSGNY